MRDSAWKPYTPTQAVPWNLRRVVHLHLRAGFAAPWSDLQRDLSDGPQASVERLIAGRARPEPEDYAERAERLFQTAVAGNRPAELGAAWLYRMLYGPDPLGERLTLMWHNHFATSNDKVDNCIVMVRQNALFRELARAPFGELLNRAVRDPALLAFLDAQLNSQDHPNENLARELMELFTVGVGHYTEADVREAARTLTGWTLERPWSANPDDRFRIAPLEQNRFRFERAQHDAGEKQVLGRRGRWNGEDLVRFLLDHPGTAARLAWRIGTEFVGGAVSKQESESLADFLRKNDLDVGRAVALVLRSERFFADATMRSRVTAPVEWGVALCRRFMPLDPPPSLVHLSQYTARLGQVLFYPPNVGGWPGGRSWINATSLIGRANLAADMIQGRLGANGRQPVDVLGLIRQQHAGTSPEQVISSITELVFGGTPDTTWSERVRAACDPTASPDNFARHAAIAILASPEAQLG
jgi:uncharacterized protein (DUF1800 family)